MKRKKMFVLLLLVFLIFIKVYSEKSEKESSIKLVNDKVAQIEKGIKEKIFSSIDIYYKFEIITVNIRFYYRIYTEGIDSESCSFSLVCAKFNNPKESYWNEYFYFFDNDEKLIKFTKQTFNREDNPPKQAKIYDKNGKIVWSNYSGELPIDTAELKSIFKGFNEKLLKLVDKHLSLI